MFAFNCGEPITELIIVVKSLVNTDIILHTSCCCFLYAALNLVFCALNSTKSLTSVSIFILIVAFAFCWDTDVIRSALGHGWVNWFFSTLSLSLATSHGLSTVGAVVFTFFNTIGFCVLIPFSIKRVEVT